MNLAKIGMWMVGHFMAVVLLVKQGVQLAEQAGTETDAKKQAAIDLIVTGLNDIGMPTGADHLVSWILGGMIAVEVAALNLVHGHNWYGTDVTTVSPQALAAGTGNIAPSDPNSIVQTEQVAAANAQEKANAELRATPVDGSPSPSAPSSSPTAPVKPTGLNPAAGRNPSAG